MSELKHLPPDTSSQAVCEALSEDGACIIDDAMAPGLLVRLKSEIMPYVEATAAGLHT